MIIGLNLNPEDDIKYMIKTAPEEKIFLHLQECKNEFIPSLEKAVSIKDYAGKIYQYATTFEAWSGTVLVGLVAAYFNDTQKKVGYITNVSVLPAYKGKRIASRLVSMCIGFAMQNKFLGILLEVNNRNGKAIALYTRYGFIKIEDKDDNIIMKKIVS